MRNNRSDEVRKGRQVVGAFLTNFAEQSSFVKNILAVSASENKCFEYFSTQKDYTEVSSVSHIPSTNSFDLFLGNFPIGLPSKPFDSGTSDRVNRLPQNWLDIHKSVNCFSKRGKGFFVLEPNFFWSNKGIQFQSILAGEGYFVEAFFRMSEGGLAPHTPIRPLLTCISRIEQEKVFVGELVDQEKTFGIVENLLNSVDSHDMSEGTFVKLDSFRGFDQYHIDIQIDRLETQFKNYEKRKIGDIAEEINVTKAQTDFAEIDNAVYIPRIGKSGVVQKAAELRIKPHNYYQVVLKPEVMSEYLVSFFASALGRLVLDSLQSNSFIPKVNKTSLVDAEVAIPSLNEQRSIAATRDKIQELKAELEKLESELSLNPTSSSSKLTRLDAMLEAVGSLSEADKVRALVRIGESKTIEYKETYCLDIRKGTKEPHIELMVLKTLVAFLNTDGGTLLVGVSDDGGIPGIQNDLNYFRNSSDKFLLHVKNRMKEKIGEQFYPYLDHRLVDVDSKLVLVVECKRSADPCFLDSKEFYVRTNPATDKLEGQKQHDYIKHHFNK